MAGDIDWKRVGEAVALRRAELGFRTQEDAAEAADVGVQTWRMIEGAKQEHYRSRTLAAVAAALDWPSNMLMRIGLGEEPPGEGTVDRDSFLRLRSEIAELRVLLEDVRDVLRSQAHDGSQDSPPAAER